MTVRLVKQVFGKLRPFMLRTGTFPFYPKNAMSILQDLYAEAETRRISEYGTLTKEALSELNPTTTEGAVEVSVEDLLSNGKVEMVSFEGGKETYGITDEGYEFMEEHIPTDELISDYEITDLSQTEIS